PNLSAPSLSPTHRFPSYIRIPKSGPPQAYFPDQAANNPYSRDMSSSALTLKKRFVGVLYTIATIPTPIVINTDYTAKLRVTGPSLEVWWQGALKWSGTDN